MSEQNPDYKSTLNLPYTDFPMRANLAAREPQMLEKWASLDLYQQIRKKGEGQPPFVLHDGPPYANGNIHIGHAINKILKDMIIKSKSLSGFDVSFIPGWDCHGLPIELNVEKKIGKPGPTLTEEAFRHACRNFAQEQVAIQKSSFKRLGIMADWDKPYLTMDYEYQADIIRAFGQIYSKGHIEKGVRPVHWCTACGSALAEAEVEYQDKCSPAIDVLFPFKNNEGLLKAFGLAPAAIMECSVVIWTTTPWTLPANEAIAVHPEIDYALITAQWNEKTISLVVAEKLVDALKSRINQPLTLLATCKGQALESLKVTHPFIDKTVPIVLGQHVTLDAGTGLVHTAPAHGLDDYYLSHHYQLPVESPVNAEGRFNSDTPIVGGDNLPTANTKIIDFLRDNYRLLHFQTLEHSYPHCWRHKTPLIFRATPQWFVSMSNHALRKQALDGIDNVNWVPEWGQSRIKGMVRERPDWCISRQRTWGVPIVMFLHKETNQPHPQTNAIIDHVANLVETAGIEIWHQLDTASLPFENLDEYYKSTDALDVWFESGVSHQAVLARRKALHFPADLYLEGSDQHRGWFQSSLLTAIAIKEAPPYQSVLTHGFTVDANGRKMSKSLGNVVAPEKIVKTLGADILRLWVAATDYRGDIHVSDEIFKRTSEAYRRIRNTARFLLANLNGYDYQSHHINENEFLALDAWIIERTQRIQEEIINAYHHYQFHVIYQKIHNFCSTDLGSIYLDIIKDRQYTMLENSVARRSAQTAMYHIVHAFSRWLAPILSFTAEEIWSAIPNQKMDSVFLANWYEDFPKTTHFNIDWDTVLSVRAEVNKALEEARHANQIRSNLAAEVHLYVNKTLYTKLNQFKDELRFILITSEALLHPFDEKPTESKTCEIDEMAIVIQASSHSKCQRCWHHRKDVNENSTYPNLCGRCVLNVQSDKGEVRQYA